MTVMASKRDILNKLIEKQKKKTPGLKLGFGDAEELIFLPTPFSTLDALLQHSQGKGIPRGKFGVVAGPQQVAKTTLMLQIIAYNQSIDPEFIGLWTDVEQAFDPFWATQLGVDLDRLIVHKPTEAIQNAEAILDLSLELVKSKSIDMWVIDSIGALAPKSEIEKNIEENAMLDIQRKFGLFFRKASALISSDGKDFKGTAVVMIGQVYTVPTATVSLEEVRGGNAVKHWAYWRWKIRRGRKDAGGPIIDVTGPDGNIMKVQSSWPQCIKIDKTKINDKESQEIILQFVPGRGLDSAQAAINSLFGNNIIERRGAWYFHELLPEGKMQGKEAIIELLKKDDSLRNQLIQSMDKLLITQEITKEEVTNEHKDQLSNDA